MELTKQLGDSFIANGTYLYARNNEDFDLNYRSLVGDVDAIKNSPKSFGQTNIGLTKDEKIYQLKFDPLKALFRQKQRSSNPTSINLSKNNSASLQISQTSSSSLKMQVFHSVHLNTTSPKNTNKNFGKSD